MAYLGAFHIMVAADQKRKRGRGWECRMGSDHCKTITEIRRMLARDKHIENLGRDNPSGYSVMRAA
jgi:hypothetical protein